MVRVAACFVSHTRIESMFFNRKYGTFGGTENPLTFLCQRQRKHFGHMDLVYVAIANAERNNVTCLGFVAQGQ